MSELVLLAAGGTGGHVNPAVALARALEARGWRALLLTDARGARFVPEALDRVVIDAFSPSGSAGKLRAAIALAKGAWRAWREIGAREPAVAVGFGSYAAAPTMLAAFARRTPSVVHEQNAVLGRANRLACLFASALAASFEGVRGRPARIVARTLVTGNPVRPEFERTEPKPLYPGERLRISVFGGSQGARVLSEKIPAAIARLSPEAQARIDVVQQCREEDLERVRALYRTTAALVELETYFHDVAERMKAAHLVISRSGASSVAEIAGVGRASVLFPLPHALDDDQGENARRFERAGAAIVASDAGFEPEAFAVRLETWLADPGELSRMSRAAAELARPDAAERLADLVIDVARGRAFEENDR